jgi:6-phosphogluconate dehydrogenase
VKKNINNPWEWDCLSLNPNMTWSNVMDSPNELWNWHIISGQFDIDWDTVEQNQDKLWNWGQLCRNKFINSRKHFERRVKHQLFVQTYLLEEFIKAYMHPKRIVMLLNMGYNPDELDNIL